MIGILAFEGPDKVGKSTLIRELNRMTDYKYLCVDRFLGSAGVYDVLSDRRERTAALLAAEQEFATLATCRVVNVLVSCDPTLLADRIAREDEFAPARLEKLTGMIDLYEHYKTVTRLPYIEIDTTSATTAESVEEIIGKLAAYGT